MLNSVDEKQRSNNFNKTKMTPEKKSVAEFNQLTKRQARNFQNYLRQHHSTIPKYQLY